MLPISALIRGGSTVWTVSPDDTVLDALNILAERNIGVVPVVHSGNLVGIFSERDYTRRVGLLGRSAKTTLISEVMTENVQTVNPDESIDECMQIVVSLSLIHI